MWETRVRSLSWEDPLEKEMAIYSGTIDWKIPWTEELGRLQSMGSKRAEHDWATPLHFTTLPLVSALSQMSAVRVTLGVTWLPRGLHCAAGGKDRDQLPCHLVPQLMLQCLLEGRCIAETMTALRHLEYSQHRREYAPQSQEEHPTSPGPAAVTLCSLSPHPWHHWQPPSLGPQGCFVIYGAPVSSRTWGGEPEIIYFVLSLSFKGKRNALGKGINVCPTWVS